MSDCDLFEPELSAYLDGELPAPQTERVRAHLARCAACTGELARLRGVGGVLRRWDAEETRYAATNSFRSRVLAAVGSGRERAASPRDAAAAPESAGRLLLLRAAAAAVVLVAAGAGVAIAWPRRGADPDLARLGAELERMLEARLARGVPAGGGDAESLDVAALDPWRPVVRRGGAAPREHDAAAQMVPEVWEEHGTMRVVQDAFPQFDHFNRERRDLQFREEIQRRVERGATAADAHATTDVVRTTVLGRHLAAVRVADGTFAPFEQVQVWPIVHRSAVETPADAAAALPVDEALAIGILSVEESPQDGMLVVRNNDRRSRSVLVLAGDVFYGGHRDRVAAEDALIVPGQTRSMRAFTSGDERRGAARRFARSDGLALHRVRALLAAGGDQALLDRSVASALPQLGAAGGGGLGSAFANDLLQSRADRYLRAFSPRLRSPEVIGFAVAAGSELLGVETFRDHATFDALSARVLRSYVLEALARPRLVGDAPEADAVTAALAGGARAANSGDPGDVAAFVEPDARLSGAGLVADGAILHAVLFAGDAGGAGGVAAARSRGGLADGTGAPDVGGDGGEPATGPGRGPVESGGLNGGNR